MKSKIVNLVIKQYINSRDFNGLPAYFLIEQVKISEERLKAMLAELIGNDEIAFSLYVNPHIRPFD